MNRSVWDRPGAKSIRLGLKLTSKTGVRRGTNSKHVTSNRGLSEINSDRTNFGETRNLTTARGQCREAVMKRIHGRDPLKNGARNPVWGGTMNG
jgi:hypothetical protein